MVEDINEKVSFAHPCSSGPIADDKHVEAWSAMLDANEPPIAHSQITPYLGEHAFKSMSSNPRSSLLEPSSLYELLLTLMIEHAISLDGSKARKILGFKPSKPKVEVEELKRIVKGFQDDGIW
jgi:hypothetical protein